MKADDLPILYYIYICTWRYPKMRVSPNHQFYFRIFNEIKYPAIGVA